MSLVYSLYLSAPPSSLCLCLNPPPPPFFLVLLFGSNWIETIYIVQISNSRQFICGKTLNREITTMKYSGQRTTIVPNNFIIGQSQLIVSIRVFLINHARSSESYKILSLPEFVVAAIWSRKMFASVTVISLWPIHAGKKW